MHSTSFGALAAQASGGGSWPIRRSASEDGEAVAEELGPE